MELKFDLTIAQSRIYLCSREVDDAELNFGQGNLAQGVRIENGLVVLDALADEEEFGCDVLVRVAPKFLPNRQAKRALRMPFSVIEPEALTLASPADEEPLELELEAGDYTLNFEVCLGSEVYYIITITKTPCAQAVALKADGWGIAKDQVLASGLF